MCCALLAPQNTGPHRQLQADQPQSEDHFPTYSFLRERSNEGLGRGLSTDKRASTTSGRRVIVRGGRHQLPHCARGGSG